MTTHKPLHQKAPVGRFIVCSCGDFRSGFDPRESAEQFASHLRLYAVPQRACSRPSPFARLTQPQCVAGPDGHEGACEFPGTAGRTPLKVNPK